MLWRLGAGGAGPFERPSQQSETHPRKQSSPAQPRMELETPLAQRGRNRLVVGRWLHSHPHRAVLSRLLPAAKNDQNDGRRKQRRDRNQQTLHQHFKNGCTHLEQLGLGWKWFHHTAT